MNTATGLAQEALAGLTALPCGGSFRAASALPDRGARPEHASGVDMPSGYAGEAGARPASAPGLWELHSTISWVQGRQRAVTLVTMRHVSAACRWAAP
jgi:hypothetical protein